MPPTIGQNDHPRIWVPVVALFALRLAIGLVLVFRLDPLSVDDYYRMFYAAWWWEHPGFTSSYVWLPGHQYLYGLVAGMTGDLITAPRIFTLLLHLGTAGVMLAAPVSFPQRMAAAAWILFSPLSFVLGTIPLAESGCWFFCTLGLVLTARYLQSGRTAALFCAAFALLWAFMFRYEAWPFWLAFALAAGRRRPAGISRPVHLAMVGVPLIFPIVWTVFCGASQGEFFAFLSATKDDHFGPGFPLDIARSPMGIMGLIQLGIAVAALVSTRVWKGFALRIFEQCFALSVLVVIGIIAADALPSQYVVRVLYGPVILGAMAVSAFLVDASRRRRWTAGMAFGLLAGCGVAGALATPSQVDEEDRRAAAWIRHQIDSGAIGDDGHVLVSYWLPEATALYVLSNRMDRVHLDAMGARCSVQFLLPFAPTCPLPEWGERVQIVIARKSSLEEDYIRSQKWRPVKDFGVWAAYRRPAGTVFPQERNKAPDPMFLR